MTSPLFGMDLSTSAAPGADPVRDARQAERLGFDFVSASDHPCGTHPTYETWTCRKERWLPDFPVDHRYVRDRE